MELMKEEDDGCSDAIPAQRPNVLRRHSRWGAGLVGECCQRKLMEIVPSGV
jgi:hypothetical protein